MLPFPIDTEKDTICDVIRRWAKLQPDAAALASDFQEPLSYGTFVTQMDGIRENLLKLGLGRGDRIAIVHSGGANMAAVVTGVCSVATAVPLNPRYTSNEFQLHLTGRAVDAVAIEAGLESEIEPALAELQLPRLEIVSANKSVSGCVHIQGEVVGDSFKLDERAIADNYGLVLGTSGTTSKSKTVPLRHRQIMLRSAYTANFLELRADDRCINLNQLFLHGGIANVFASFFSGGTVIFIKDFSAENFLLCAEALAPTWYVGGFTHNRKIYDYVLSKNSNEKLGSLRFVRTSSGPLDAQIADGLESNFGVPVIEAYSSTETGRISGNPRPPGLRKRGTVGIPTGGEVAITDARGEILPNDQIGEVVVRGKHVFDGYENDPEANAEAFRDGWFRMGDAGFIDGDGYLTLTGRIKEMINRGGEKVSPAEIDEALLSHPDVSDAATFSLPHPTLGEEVAAAIVQARGAALTDQILTRYLLDRLSGFKVPRRFYFVSEIPKSDAGKLQRHKLAEALGVRDEIGTHAAGSLDREPTPLEAQLQAIWAGALRIPQVGLDDNFFMLGGDSLQAVELFLRIEKELGRRLPRAILFEAGTVAEMSQRIEDLTPSPCLVPIQPKGDGLPFFCIHDGNGEVLNYRDLARLVGEAQPFYGIQCRGLDGEDVPFTRIEDMAAHYVGEIRKIQPVGPYLLGGYSFGGRVAYVMAQQLRTMGEEVALLALFDTSSGYGQRRVTLRDWLAHHGERLRALPLQRMPAYLGLRVSNLAKMLYMGVRLRSFSMAWRFFERRGWQLPRILRRPVPANDIIRRDYKPQPYDGNAILFKAERYAWTHADAHEGWRELIKGKLEIRPISGRHYEIVKQPHVRTLAGELSDALDQAQAASAEPAGVLAKQS